MTQRRSFSKLPVILAMLALTACTKDEKQDSIANVPGTYARTLTVGTATRETLIYVPALAAGTTPVPVVFMLHGTSGDGQKFYAISGWKELADVEGFIAVFPSALWHCLKEDENADGDFDDPGELTVTTKWAAGQLGTATMPLCTAEELAARSADARAVADHPIADDLAFFDAQLALLSSEYAVDAKRIFVSGFSNGAQMSSTLALRRSDKFAAAAAHAGNLFNPDGIVPTRPMSFVFSVGELDDRFTSLLKIAALPMDETLYTSYPLFEAGLIDPLVAMTGVNPTYTHQTVPGGSIFDYTGSSTTLRVAVLKGNTHAYPNGTNHPVVMAEQLWARWATESLP